MIVHLPSSCSKQKCSFDRSELGHLCELKGCDRTRIPVQLSLTEMIDRCGEESQRVVSNGFLILRCHRVNAGYVLYNRIYCYLITIYLRDGINSHV